jgi:hypothetical protein
VERIGREVERELGRTGGGAEGQLATLTSLWPAAVGEAIARRAWPLRLARDGTLHVAAVSATWAFELDRLAADILERLREHAGEQAPRALRFRVGPVPEPPLPPAERAPARPPPPPPDAAAEAAEAAAAIEDQELRELVERAARASLARARSGRGF